MQACKMAALQPGTVNVSALRGKLLDPSSWVCSETATTTDLLACLASGRIVCEEAVNDAAWMLCDSMFDDI